ncbi:MAG TPA: hypothetical protein VLG11_04300 [Candidatus Saccharimonadales bacterium]|nr:hypothetical protein [Candidatus Saccharimonadales bacterium]
MKTALIIISTILTIVSVIPYIRETLNGKTKPRIVTWFTWSLLTAIACAASYSDKQYPSAILMFFATIEALSVALLGLKHGDRKIARFDIVCQVAAIVGIILWLIFNSPTIAVAAAVTIDLVGALPTLKHAWQKPGEETAITFALAGIGGLCTVLAAANWKITAVAYPLYIFLINIVIVAFIIGRTRHAKVASPPEL